MQKNKEPILGLIEKEVKRIGKNEKKSYKNHI